MKKFTFNKQTLSYVQTKTPFHKKLIRFSLRVIPGIIIGSLLFYFIYDKILFPSEQELVEIQNNKILKYKELNNKLNKISMNIIPIIENDNELYRPMLKAHTLPSGMRSGNFGGVDHYKQLRGYENSEVMIRTELRLDVIISQLLIQSQSFDEITDVITEVKKRQACYPDLRPVRLQDVDAVCTFGMRMQPFLKIYRMHKGVDLCAPADTKIYAAADGVVVLVKFHYSLGNYIRIKHDYGYLTVYGHLNKAKVKVGQKVKKGDLIALMGTTGLSEVNHLHYEIYKNGKEVNPALYYYDDLCEIELEQLDRNPKEAEGFMIRRRN